MNWRSPIRRISDEIASALARFPAATMRRDLFLLVRAQAAAGEAIARHQIDFRACDARQFLRHAIVENEPERDDADDFGFREFRRLRRDEQKPAVDGHDVASRLSGGGATDRRDERVGGIARFCGHPGVAMGVPDGVETMANCAFRLAR